MVRNLWHYHALSIWYSYKYCFGVWLSRILGHLHKWLHFSFCYMSPTLLDVTDITRLLVDRDELLTFFTLLVDDLSIHFSKSRALHLAFFVTNVKWKGLMFDAGHHAFLLYWLSKYFIYINFVVMVLGTHIMSLPLLLVGL